MSRSRQPVCPPCVVCPAALSMPSPPLTWQDGLVLAVLILLAVPLVAVNWGRFFTTWPLSFPGSGYLKAHMLGVMTLCLVFPAFLAFMLSRIQVLCNAWAQEENSELRDKLGIFGWGSGAKWFYVLVTIGLVLVGVGLLYLHHEYFVEYKHIREAQGTLSLAEVTRHVHEAQVQAAEAEGLKSSATGPAI